MEDAKIERTEQEIEAEKKEKAETLAKFGQRIHALRKNRGYTLADVVKLCNQYGISTNKSSWSKWEKGLVDPGLTKLITIADIYGVTLDYLTGLCDDPHGYRKSFTNKNKLSSDEVNLLNSFGSATDDTQKAIRRVLNIRKKRTHSINEKGDGDTNEKQQN